MRNYEVNAVILGRAFTSRIEDLFADYLSRSDEIRLAAWEKRSTTERMREWFSRLIWYLL